jgi:hypothetical protein
LDWRAKVELFEQIRQEYEFGLGTITGVVQKLGVHRRMVREAIGNAMPKTTEQDRTAALKLKAAVESVDAVLEVDCKAPRKQRHTAHRIWERIQRELLDYKIGETVRQYVHNRKIALGILVRETCVPQSYPWCVEAAGGLVRSLCRCGRRAGEASGIRDAQHGQRSGVPLRLIQVRTDFSPPLHPVQRKLLE